MTENRFNEAVRVDLQVTSLSYFGQCLIVRTRDSCSRGFKLKSCQALGFLFLLLAYQLCVIQQVVRGGATMLEFEPRAFGVGIDRNANHATTMVLV